MRRILILGAGTAGTTLANRLARRLRPELRAGRVAITVVDRDDRHIYQPGLLFLPFALSTPDRIVRGRRVQLGRGIEYVEASVTRIEPASRLVLLEGRAPLPYDVLVIATGASIDPAETEGMLGPGWRDTVFDFYTLEGARALAAKLDAWRGGRLVVNIVEMPIKCPVAPLEFAFLADAYLRTRGRRARSTITYVTPLDGAFTKPVAAARLSHLLAAKGIDLVTEFDTARVDGVTGELSSWDDRTVPFDLLVTVPVHTGAAFLAKTPGLADDRRFVRVDPQTLQARHSPDIFAIGDATDLPTSKAGSVAHFEAELLARNIERFLAGEPLAPDFDGHANCFIETGFGKALLIDFNYGVEPLPGRFPLPWLGPLSLLEESRLNHLGKLAFGQLYWHLLLPGRDIPFVSPRLSMRGKERPWPGGTAGAEPSAAPRAARSAGTADHNRSMP